MEEEKEEKKLGFLQEPEEVYHATEAMSASQLIKLSESAHSLEYYRENGQESTKDMDLGTMIHYFILEHSKFKEKYCIAPNPEDYPRALKGVEMLRAKCKEFKIPASGTKAKMIERLKEKDSSLQFWDEIEQDITQGGKLQLLTDNQVAMLLGIEKSIMKHSRLKAILSDGIPEVSGYTDDIEYDIYSKMRADWLTGKDYIVDLKKCQKGYLRAWQRKLVDFRYDIQAAWYCRLFAQIQKRQPKGFIHFVIESNAPFNVYAYFADPTVIECGETGGKDTIGYRQALDLYLECRANGFWPLPQSDIEAESMPEWFI